MKLNDLKSEYGTATVEVAIMLPLYVFLLISMLFFSSYHITNVRMIREVAYISQKSGEQTEGDLSDALDIIPTERFPNNVEGPILKDEVFDELFEEEDLIAFMKEEAYEVNAHYDGSQITYSTDVTSAGKLIEKYDLYALSQDLADELGLWLERTETSLDFSMTFPFSDSSGKTEVDLGSELKMELSHRHRDVIRKLDSESTESQYYQRYSYNELADAQSALDQLIYDGWDMPDVSTDWEEFWETDWIDEAEEE
ncbi:MAG: pilus assembly protein [Planctomycetes bacterium]|nr:pilus assembly protein [Planctomycetota bacterium]